jgi:hypothetical protein
MTETTRVQRTPSNVEIAIANGVTFVLPTAILKENINIIDETEEYDVYTMRAPRAARPDDAGLLALSHDDDLGEKFAAFLAERVRRLAKNRGMSE